MHFQHLNLLLGNARRQPARWVLVTSALVGNQLQADITPRMTDLITPLGVFGHQTPPTAYVSEQCVSCAAQSPRLAFGHMSMNVLVAPHGRLSMNFPSPCLLRR